MKTFFSWINRLDTRLLLIADQSLISAAGFLSNFLLAWKLQLEGYGIYALVYLGMMLLMSFQQALFIQPAQVFLSKLGEYTSRKYTAAILVLAFPATLLLALIFELIFQLIYQTSIPTGILFIVSWIWLFSDLLRKLCIILKPGIKLVLIDALNMLLFTGLILTLSPKSPASALLILAISAATGFLFLFILKPISSGKRLRNYYIHKTSSTAGWMVVTSVVQWSSSNYLLMAAGAWISAASLGLLRLTQYLFGLLNIFLQAYENYAVPKVAAWTGRANEKASFVLKISAAFLIPVAFLLILLALFFPTVAKLISPQDITEPLHIWIALLYLLIVIAYPIRVLIRASGFNQIYFFAHVVSLIFILISAGFLIRNYQSAGIVVGMMLSQVLMASIWIIFLFHKKQFTWKLSTSH